MGTNRDLFSGIAGICYIGMDFLMIVFDLIDEIIYKFTLK